MDKSKYSDYFRLIYQNNPVLTKKNEQPILCETARFANELFYCFSKNALKSSNSFEIGIESFSPFMNA